MPLAAIALKILKTQVFSGNESAVAAASVAASDFALCVREDTAFAANRGDDPPYRTGEWFRSGPAQEGDMTLTLLDPVTGKRVTITVDETGRIV